MAELWSILENSVWNMLTFESRGLLLTVPLEVLSTLKIVVIDDMRDLQRQGRLPDSEKSCLLGFPARRSA